MSTILPNYIDSFSSIRILQIDFPNELDWNENYRNVVRQNKSHFEIKRDCLEYSGWEFLSTQVLLILGKNGVIFVHSKVPVTY